MALKERLTADGSVFTSETDAEVIAHLIAAHYSDDLAEAVRAALRRARGPLRVRRDEPRRARGARRRAQGVPADHRPRRGRAVRRLGRAGVPRADARGAVPGERRDRRRCARTACRSRPPPASTSSAGSRRVDWDEETAEKGGFDTFMLKEIHEQADAVADTIFDRTARGDGVDLDEEGALDEAILAGVERIVDRRLRHRLPRRPDRPLRARGVGAGPGRDGHRLRVPLPQPGRRRAAIS